MSYFLSCTGCGQSQVTRPGARLGCHACASRCHTRRTVSDLSLLLLSNGIHESMHVYQPPHSSSSKPAQFLGFQALSLCTRTMLEPSIRRILNVVGCLFLLLAVGCWLPGGWLLLLWAVGNWLPGRLVTRRSLLFAVSSQHLVRDSDFTLHVHCKFTIRQNCAPLSAPGSTICAL